jgi:hypothetical protein
VRSFYGEALASIQQHQMPMLPGGQDRLDGQRRRVLATRAPDDVDGRTVEALDQTRPDGYVLLAPATCQVGHRTGDPGAMRAPAGEVGRLRRELHSASVGLLKEPEASTVPSTVSVRERTEAIAPHLLCSLPHSAIAAFALRWPAVQRAFLPFESDPDVWLAGRRMPAAEVAPARGSVSRVAQSPRSAMRTGRMLGRTG